MPRVHKVEKARKPIESAGVAVGDSYYWWKFRNGGKQISKTYPKPSQLTQSEFLGQWYSLEEDFSDLDWEGGLGLKEGLEDIVGELESLRDDCEEKISNMEERFPNGCPAMELLQSRVDRCDSLISEIEGITNDLEEPEGDEVIVVEVQPEEVDWSIE